MGGRGNTSNVNTTLSFPLVVPPTSLVLVTAASAAAAAAAAAWWASTRVRSDVVQGKSPKRSMWERWFPALSQFTQSYEIRNVNIPIAALGDPQEKAQGVAAVVATADHEGLVVCHVHVKKGTIAALEVATNNNTSEAAAQSKTLVKPKTTLDLQGRGILFPCAIDAHTHLIKTESVPRRPNALGTWSQALEGDIVDEARYWKNNKDTSDLQDNDIYRRMEFAIQCALHYGTRALRTHLDGCASEDDPVMQDLVYAVFTQLQQKYADRLVLQGVANLYLPLWCITDLATAHADRAAAAPGVVLGAYVGNHTHQEAVQGLTALLDHAQRVGNIDVDLHLDESNDVQCCALRALVDDRVLPAARRAGYTGRVVLGHVCSLSLQTAKDQQELVAALAQDDKVYVVANPVTNLALQDRRGSAAPQSVPIPAHIPRTPQWRGLTLVQELQAAGVSVAAATDNVRDGWYAYGDYDWLTTWMAALSLAHLDTAPAAGHWAHLLSDAPAAAMGLMDDDDSKDKNRLLAVGQPADFVLFPTTRRLTELLARPMTSLRWVIRQGCVQQNTPLPDFAVLEDLMEEAETTASSSLNQPSHPLVSNSVTAAENNNNNSNTSGGSTSSTTATQPPVAVEASASRGILGKDIKQGEARYHGDVDGDDDFDHGVDGMAQAESRAHAAKFRNIGFHQSYDSAKEELLQQGFELGFQETFDTAKDIGKILGDAVVKATFSETVVVGKEGSSSSFSASSSAQAAGMTKLDDLASMIREQLTASNLQSSDLQDLKTKLLQETSAL